MLATDPLLGGDALGEKASSGGPDSCRERWMRARPFPRTAGGGGIHASETGHDGGEHIVRGVAAPTRKDQSAQVHHNVTPR